MVTKSKAELLRLAVSLHHKGDLKEAEKLYQDILLEDPNQPDAHYNMGMLKLEEKDFDLSLQFFKSALEANPSEQEYWLSYIAALIQVGQYTESQLVLSYGLEAGLSIREAKSFVPFKLMPANSNQIDSNFEQAQNAGMIYKSNVTVLGKSRLVFDMVNNSVFLDIVEDDELYGLMSDYFFHDELFNVIGYDVENKNIYFKRTYTRACLNLEPVLYLEGQWLSLLHHGSENWMHWISEILPRLILSNDIMANDAGLIVDADLPETMYQSIKIASGNRKLVKINRHNFVHVDELLIPRKVSYSLIWERGNKGRSGKWHFDVEALQKMRMKLLTSIENSKQRPQLIYCQRKSTFRHIQNEEALRLMLEDTGFVTIDTNNMSTFEQIETFKNCKLLVSQAGAALANIAFMQAGSLAIVLTLDSEHIDYKYFEEYAEIFGVSITYVMCQSANPENYFPEAVFTFNHPSNHDLICDLNLVKSCVLAHTNHG